MKKLVIIIVLITIYQVTQAQKTNYFDKTGMDNTINPADNFFLYANGTWIKNATIPDDQSRWGGFNILYQDNLKKLRTILEEAAAKNNPKGSAAQKIGDYYASGMDTIAIEKLGYEPLKPMLQKIDALKDYKELLHFIAENYATPGIDLIGLNIETDEKNSIKNIITLSQTGLTLPEKDYYVRTDAKTIEQRKKMAEYATTLFTLTGTDLSNAQKAANDILALETAIAKSHSSQVELRDPIKNYNKMSLADLQKKSPNINWQEIFTLMGIKADSIDVQQPQYFKTLDTLLTTQPITIWKNKIKFDYIAHNANALTKPFRNAQFEFGKVFSGQKIQQERWKTMINVTDQGLRDLLGQLYAQKYFPLEAKKRIDELVNNLQKAFQYRIEKLDWMSATTKQRAQEKLKAIIKKVGYPDQWKNFDDVTISRNNYFANRQSVALHNYKKMIEKLNKPVDKTDWIITVPTVNAYYQPVNNEIAFPAGILQPPFFDLNADDAINYGGIGMVIGHEITHGFDDMGRQFDKDGNLKEWWLPEDADKFKEKAKLVVNQYNQYTVLDSLHVNGELTLGENLADIGGIAIAYDAFKLTKQGQSQEKIDGFTPDQRFFLGFAQLWRLINRPQTVLVLIHTDPHSPEMYRINGPLSNFEPFYKTFNVTETNSMYRKPAERAKIW